MNFIRETPRRLDGLVAIAVTALFLLIGLTAPWIDYSIKGLDGWVLSASSLTFVPIVLVCYLRYFYLTPPNKVSIGLNAVLLLSLPVIVWVFIGE